MSGSNDKKVAEGIEHMRSAEKCMKTSLLKWSPDIDGAIEQYGKAAIAFKNAKAHEQSVACYLKTAEVQKKNKSYFHAAKSLESAASVYKEMKKYDEAASKMMEASLMYMENGTPDTAAICLDRGGKMIQNELPERAIEMYQKASDYSEGRDDPRQCAEFIGRAARLLIKLNRLDEAAEALEKELDYNAQVEAYGLINKLVMGLVLVHLHRGDSVAADKALQNSLKKYKGFMESEEAGPIESLLEAYDQGDQQKATEIVKCPLFRYMENEFTKLARDLKVPGGIENAGGSPDAEGDGGVPDLR